MVWEPCSMARQNCHLKFTGLSQPQPCVQQLPVPTNPAGTLKLHTPVTGCLWLQITPRVLQAGAPTMGVACFIQRQKHKSEVSFISCLINHLLWGKKKIINGCIFRKSLLFCKWNISSLPSPLFFHIFSSSN